MDKEKMQTVYEGELVFKVVQEYSKIPQGY